MEVSFFYNYFALQSTFCISMKEIKHPETPLETLKEIKKLMENSSRFLSLSGLAGVYAGIYALIGTFVVAYYFGIDLLKLKYQANYSENLLFLVSIAMCVLIVSIGTGLYLSINQARQRKLPFWNKTTSVWLESVLIPLITGGLFCLIMISHFYVKFVPGGTLIFYGLAVYQSSKHSYKELKWLGIAEIILGLLATLFLNYSLVFWGIGFGIFHIIYGMMMYWKYERKIV